MQSASIPYAIGLEVTFVRLRQRESSPATAIQRKRSSSSLRVMLAPGVAEDGTEGRGAGATRMPDEEVIQGKRIPEPAVLSLVDGPAQLSRRDNRREMKQGAWNRRDRDSRRGL